MNAPLPYNTLSDLRARLVREIPAFGAIGAITPVAWSDFGKPGAVKGVRFASPVKNYYQTDPISRASVTMATCVEAFAQKQRIAAG